MNEAYIEHGRTNQKQETRDRILKSAQHFLNRGIEFNLEEVAKKSGVSRATIYRYYSNVEVLSAEAGLDINTLSPEEILKKLEGKSIEDTLLGIQEYYNNLATENENAFRKYLSVVSVSNSPELKRGARRKKTLELALKNSALSAIERNHLINILTIQMGIEPLIVAKDVSGLTSTEAKRVMRLSMELILKNYTLTINN
jgi:AcrR family transcriptional regulator